MQEAKEIKYRSLEQAEELREAVALQLTAWPQESVTSMPQMAAAILNGGMVMGAYDDGRLVGFNYAFPGYDGKETYLASHMMAIHPDYRDHGIGRRLKLEQRLWALQAGYGTIVWTFDPFEPRNGYLNVVKLGGIVRRYIPSFYGNGALNIPSDRFLVEWLLRSDRVQGALEGNTPEYDGWSGCPCLFVVETRDGAPVAVRVDESVADSLATEPAGVLLPVPCRPGEMKTTDLALFLSWQELLRQWCAALFARGYRVVSLLRGDGPVNYYVLEPEE
ncbi:GNAT family N-acetyltransferase [Paenibacillus cymbidii]|uniref:GNAT family N-acetyltransferase n=1 Tax=Paenibacillus cymbidii TaxID=1639034 RepID=UPI0010806421|nr:GNAT family N-acetyltransferase [Paenibacillus cymbidii]